MSTADMSGMQGGGTPLDPGEIALSIWGMHELLKGDHDKHQRFGLGKLREMEGVEQRLYDGGCRVAKGTDGKLPFWKPETDYATMLQRLSQPLTPHELTEIVQRFPAEAHAISGPFLLCAQRAWAFLQAQFPTSRYLTFMGPESMVPDDERTWQFLTQLHVLQDPFIAYDLIASAALLPSHVMALRAVYPTLCEHITTSVYGGLAEEKAAHPDYRMPFESEQGWGTWLGRRIVEFQPTPPPGTPPGPLPKVGRPKPPQQQPQQQQEQRPLRTQSATSDVTP